MFFSCKSSKKKSLNLQNIREKFLEKISSSPLRTNEGVKLLEKSKILILIPIKDFLETKTRIKKALPPKFTAFIDSLVKLTFFQTVDTVRSVSCPFGVISPSISIINQSKKLGATFTYCDSGIDLNVALTEAVQDISQEKPILIIMPDLPYISREFFQLLFDETKNNDVLIIPSISSDENMGTAALYLRNRNILSFQFGRNSCKRFQVEANSMNLRYCVLNLDPFARDLDTLDDVKYLKQHLSMVFEPARFRRILEQIDIMPF
ncbi:MAG: hypothetical protein JSU57_00550 [Candidatus Heimdallarchaeota archaeon]|nr:MAG: hypothetical protein JSU57_00550 [Candidatus Heimdallarchaeota archaeon]